MKYLILRVTRGIKQQKKQLFHDTHRYNIPLTSSNQRTALLHFSCSHTCLREQQSRLSHVNLLFVCFTSKVALQNRKICKWRAEKRETGLAALDTVVDIKVGSRGSPSEEQRHAIPVSAAYVDVDVGRRLVQAGLWGLASSTLVAQMFRMPAQAISAAAQGRWDWLE